MAINLSYINARGEEIILDNTERTFLGELYGREGVEAPKLSYSEVRYADGSTEILAVNLEPREVTFYFSAPIENRHLEEKLEEVKQRLIQTGSRPDNWGKLKIRRRDGLLLYLNCVYTGGIDELVRKNNVSVNFSVSFRGEDPLFYTDFEQTYTIRQDDRSGYLFMGADLFMSSSLYMMSAQGNTGSDLFINGDLIYPKIIINGPAENISLVNGTTGRKIALASTVTLDMNEKITITTAKRQRTITKTDKYGVTTNLVPKLTADSSLNWWLTRGTNDIQFNNSATTPESYLRFVYREGYLSAE